MSSQQPLVVANLGALEHGSDCDSELLTAVVTLVQAGTVVRSRKLGGIDQPAVRTLCTIGPANAL
jgi:hypothetical protein